MDRRFHSPNCDMYLECYCGVSHVNEDMILLRLLDCVYYAFLYTYIFECINILTCKPV